MMAFTINHIVLVGMNLTRDAELRTARNGNARVTFSVAINSKYKDQYGNMQDKAEFFDVVFWGERAEGVSQYLIKGAKIALEGRLTQERWVDEHKQTRTAVKITATNVVLIGSKKEESGNNGSTNSCQGNNTGYTQSNTRAPQNTLAANVQDAFNGDYFDDSPLEDADLPF